MSFSAEAQLPREVVTQPLDKQVANRIFTDEIGPAYGEFFKTNSGVNQAGLPDVLDLSPQIYPGSIDAASDSADSSQRSHSDQSEILVASLHEDLPFELKRSSEYQVSPELRLQVILMNLPDPSSPGYYDAATAAFEAMKEQYDLVQRTGHAYLDFPEVHNFDALIGKEYEAALYSLPPTLQDEKEVGGKLSYLHYVVFTEQTDLAASFKQSLYDAADDHGDMKLKAYFDKLDTVKAENPEMAKQFIDTYQTYMRANDRMLRMNDRFEASPLGGP